MSYTRDLTVVVITTVSNYWSCLMPFAKYGHLVVRSMCILENDSQLNYCTVSGGLFAISFCHFSINSLAPEKCGSNFGSIIFKFITLNSSLACSIAWRWMPQSFTNKKSTWPGKAWCCQAKSHYLSPCWPRSMWHGVTRQQWVKSAMV